jgi:hypothetical protein
MNLEPITSEICQKKELNYFKNLCQNSEKPRVFLPAHFVFADTVHQRWAPALFSHFRAREHEAKKERESAKKKEREKSESANSRFFLPHTVEIRFQSPKPLGSREKARVLSQMYS